MNTLYTHILYKNNAVRFFTAVTIFSLLLSAFPAHFFVASAQTAGGGAGGGGASQAKVTICHATESAENPWNRIVVSENATGGHFENNGTPKAGHEEDLMFEGDVDCPALEVPVVPGCTDHRANNYNPDATEDDGSCTVKIKFVKKFDGVNLGFTPEQFSFLVTGDGFSEQLEHDEEFEFTIGDYTVAEIGPDEFDEADWRIKWTCPDVHMADDDGNDHDATFEVTSSNYKDGSIFCTAENQYRPDGSGTSTDPVLGCTDPTATNYNSAATSGNANAELCEYDPTTGSINGHKWNDENGDGIWDSSETGLSGWTIELTNASDTPQATTTNEDGEFWFEDLVPGNYNVCEEQQSGWTQTAPTSDDGCYDVEVIEGQEASEINFGNQEDDDGGGGGQCIPESPDWADAVESSNQGLTKDGGAITDPNRTDPTEALGASDWNNGGSTGFYSLGFGGSIVVSFDSFVSDVDGVDISIHEATNGSNYPEESALVEVRQAGGAWHSVGTASNLTDVNTRVSYFDFASTGLLWIDQVRVTDTSNPSLHVAAADGFDLDAVDASATVCSEPEDNGGGNGNTDTYRIEGYVWHDDNENSIWDGFDDQEQDATTTEDSQEGWTVTITNGTETHSTTSDSSGYYYFEVPAGTWTITETVMDGWALIAPGSGSHVVTVPDVVTQTFSDRVFAFLLPVAHAAVVDTFGLFNFGNNESSGTLTTSGGGGSGGGGGSTSPRCSLFEVNQVSGDTVLTWETRYGNELLITSGSDEVYTTDDSKKVRDGSFIVSGSQNEFELTVSRGSREDTCTAELDGPTPQVLGEQVSIVPAGAPDAGAGGTSLPVKIGFTFTTGAFVGRKFAK